MAPVLSLPASYKAVCKVPRGASPVLAGEETSLVRLCQEVRAPHTSPCQGYPTAPPTRAPRSQLQQHPRCLRHWTLQCESCLADGSPHGTGFLRDPTGTVAPSVWAGHSCLVPGTALLILLGVREQGVSLISVQGFHEANPRTRGQFWCVGVGLGRYRKLRIAFEGKLGVPGLVGHWMAGVVLRESSCWETLTGKPG